MPSSFAFLRPGFCTGLAWQSSDSLLKRHSFNKHRFYVPMSIDILTSLRSDSMPCIVLKRHSFNKHRSCVLMSIDIFYFIADRYQAAQNDIYSISINTDSDIIRSQILCTHVNRHLLLHSDLIPGCTSYSR